MDGAEEGRPGTRAGWWVLAASTCLAVAGIVLKRLAERRLHADLNVGGRVGDTVAAVVAGVVGSLVLARDRRHALGLVMVAIPVVVAVDGFSTGYGDYSYVVHPLPAGPFLAWLQSWQFVLLLTLYAQLLLRFPTGTPAPGLFARTARANLLLMPLTAFVFAVADDGPLLDKVPASTNPLGLSAPQPPAVALFLAFSATLLLACASVLVRTRRSRGRERTQLSWFGVGAAGLAVWTVLNPLLQSGLWHHVVSGFGSVGLAGLWVAVGVAVLRDRALDVDLVLTRAIVYASLATFVTGVYVGAVVGVGHLLGSTRSLALEVLATAAVALAFDPVRRAARRLANRLVYGRRAEPYELAQGLSKQLAEALSTEEVLPRVAEAAAVAVGAGSSAVRVLLGSGHELTHTWPAGAPAAPGDRVLPVVHRGQAVGEIAVVLAPGQALRPSDERVLVDLATQVAPALHNVRLSAELRERLDEVSRYAEQVRLSRQRVVRAQDLERRRIERDLHDGAQQELVALTVRLGLARQLLVTAPDRVAPLLEDLGEQAQRSLDALRDLARGVYPALLAEEGVVVALKGHVTRSLSPVDVVAPAGLPRARPEVEAALYFCCLEALQNCAKHAPGAPVVVTWSVEDGGLLVTVQDEGPGIDPARGAGSGMANMQDRIGAVDGRWSVTSGPGGTTVTAWVPAEPPQVPEALQTAASEAGSNADLLR